jgi:hypothetical protein
LENGAEESKIGIGASKLAFSLEDFEAGVVSVSPGLLKKVWNKWPGDETIEELVAALDEINGR